VGIGATETPPKHHHKNHRGKGSILSPNVCFLQKADIRSWVDCEPPTLSFKKQTLPVFN